MIDTYFIIAKTLDMKIIPDAMQDIKNKRKEGIKKLLKWLLYVMVALVLFLHVPIYLQSQVNLFTAICITNIYLSA